ncbi:Voltage-dependent calcium channel type A subunit alpha-1 [Diplonema papillatum]|nr:Voltage-dependent calcium channel type A subunit alpha-1 [Diplonema papillatum]
MSSLDKLISERIDTSGLVGNSFFIFRPDNPWRLLASYVIYHEYTIKFMYALIVTNAVSMAMVTPVDDPSSLRVQIVDIGDMVVLVLFTIEVFMKMVALGAFFGPTAFWNNGWYRLDLAIVTGSVLGLLVEVQGFSAFRAFRAFRIFRAIKYFEGFRSVMASMSKGLGLVADNSAFLAFFFLVFGVLSVELFQNSLSRWCIMENSFAHGILEIPIKAQACKLDATSVDSLTVSRGSCPENMLCFVASNQWYYHGKAHLDDIFHAVVVIWQISTLSGWTEHVYHLQEAEGSMMPVAYCVVLIFVLNYIVVNLFVAVVGAVFSRVRDADSVDHPSLFYLQVDPNTVWLETKQRRLVQTIKWGLMATDVSQECAAWGQSSSSLPTAEMKEKTVSSWERLRLQLIPLVRSRALLLVVVALNIANVAVKATDSATASDAHRFRLYIADICFTVLFAAEWFVRFVTTGKSNLRVFFSSAWDVFDSLILSVSIASLAVGNTSYSFFRLRVLQLAFYFEGLRPAASLFNRSVAGIPGAVSVVIFISLSFFVFGVAGVQLFAGKMIDETTGARTRLHFDHFASALMLLFQVMSGDSWESYMRATWHSSGVFGVIFIILFFVYSVWVLLNLFTAVVLENFDDDDETKYQEQVRQHRQAITTVPHTRKVQRGRRQSPWASVVAFVHDFLRVPAEVKKAHEEEVVEETLSHDLHSVLEQGTRMHLEALLDDITVLGREAEDHHQEIEKKTATTTQVLPVGTQSDIEMQSIVTLAEAKEAKMQAYVSKNHATRMLSAEDDSEQYHLRLPGQNALKHEALHHDTADVSTDIPYSLFIFHRTNPFRKAVHFMVSHKIYESFMMLAILLSTMALLFEPPHEASRALDDEAKAKWMYRSLRKLDWVWLGVFSQEFVFKTIAFGVVGLPGSRKKGYLNSAWNIFDVLLLAAMGLTILQPEFAIFQAFRALRPIRALRRVESLRIVVSAIWGTLPATLMIIIGINYLFLLFGLAGVQLFAGKFHRCNDASVVGKADCIGVVPHESGFLVHRVWNKPAQHFDTVIDAVFTLIEVTSLASWTLPTFNSMDITAKDIQPEFMSSPMNGLFFVVVVIICSFYLVNIFVAVILDRIYQEMGISIMTGNQRAWTDFQKTIKLFESQMQGVHPPDESSSSIRLILYAAVTHKWFDPFIIILIAVNIGFMASQHASQPDAWTEVQDTADMVFLCIYTVEMCIKMIAYGGAINYFRNRWNAFDAFVVAGSIASLILKYRTAGDAASVGVVRMLRIARVFKLMTAATGMKFLFKTLILSLPAIFNIVVLAFIFIVIYTVFGKSFFGAVRFQAYISNQANFRTTLNGLGTVFRMLTLDQWHFLSHDCQLSEPFCTVVDGEDWFNDCGHPKLSRMFFLSFYVMGVYIFLNLILAVILDNFGHIFSENSFCLTEAHIAQLDDLWCQRDEACGGELPRYQVRELLNDLHKLGNPLGCDMSPPLAVGKKRFEFVMYALGDLRPQQTKGSNSLVFAKWADVIQAATLTFIRFSHPECLKYGQNKMWQAEFRRYTSFFNSRVLPISPRLF